MAINIAVVTASPLCIVLMVVLWIVVGPIALAMQAVMPALERNVRRATELLSL
jgi:hypothetical protein